MCCVPGKRRCTLCRDCHVRRGKRQGEKRGEERERRAALDARAIGRTRKVAGSENHCSTFYRPICRPPSAGGLGYRRNRARRLDPGRAVAQDFAGAAGDLGLTGITAAARALSQGARDGAGNEAL